jgi:Uma2 family endonuclease
METYATHIPVHLNLHRPVRKYTLKEYLQKEAKSVDKHEFINGQIIKMPYAKGPHNIIAANMMVALGIEFEKQNDLHMVLGPDQLIYFPSLNSGVYADAFAVCENPIYWDDNELLLINPLLVVEVLSKSTSKYDRSGKFEKYKTLESFREYVLIRQDECYAEVWFRESPGRWQETIVTDITQILPLQSVSINLSMQKVYKKVNLKIEN